MSTNHYELNPYAEDISNINDIGVLKNMSIMLKMIVQTTGDEDYQLFSETIKHRLENNIKKALEPREIKRITKGKRKYIQAEDGGIYYIKKRNKKNRGKEYAVLYALATKEKQREHSLNKHLVFTDRFNQIQAKVFAKGMQDLS